VLWNQRKGRPWSELNREGGVDSGGDFKTKGFGGAPVTDGGQTAQRHRGGGGGWFVSEGAARRGREFKKGCGGDRCLLRLRESEKGVWR
jgi:hypothetical protein